MYPILDQMKHKQLIENTSQKNAHQNLIDAWEIEKNKRCSQLKKER